MKFILVLLVSTNAFVDSWNSKKTEKPTTKDPDKPGKTDQDKYSSWLSW